MVIKQPIGVCAAITPWNFPIAMITRKCAPGLGGGCTFVVKPAEQTPYCALALVALAEQAGMPKGVFNVITCDSSKAPEVGKVLCASPIVKKVTFTGSTEVGRILMRQSADTVKKMGLELGGNASFIVFDDADIDAPLSKARWPRNTATPARPASAPTASTCRTRCTTPSPPKLTEKVKQMKVGQGFGTVMQGPLIDGQALKKVQGARCRRGEQGRHRY